MQGHYLKNWNKWPLPVIPVAKELNPFYNYGVEMSVALAYHLPYENIKFITVYGLLKGAQERGLFDAHNGVHTLVEATSGNTGIVLSLMAKEFGIKHVKLVVTADIPEGKRFPLVMAGAELIPPEEGMSGIATARKLGGGGWIPRWPVSAGSLNPSIDGCLNLDQYGNLDGVKLHSSFTAPKILEQLDYPPTVFVAGVGTGGTLIGISNFLRNTRTKIVGTLLSPGNEIPGVRDFNRMKEITLPWRDFLDQYVEVETKLSYLASLWFNWIMGLTPGPSSGFAYLGALKFLKEKKDSRTLDDIRDGSGKVRVVILFPDGNRPYGDRYMANLPFEYLKPSTAPPLWKLI